jgi:hypothetical protein
MDNIVQLAAYRESRRLPASEHVERRKLWACGSCGGHFWTVSVDRQIRCADCDARAGNLHVIEAGSAGGMHQ